MDEVNVVQIVGILAAILGEGQEPAIAGQMISAALIESYGRENEVDADTSGAELMIEAGYDPLGMIEFFGYMEGLERRRPGFPGNYFTIHPHADERIDILSAHLKTKGINFPDNLYRLHLALDFDCRDVDDHFECTVFIGDEGAFVLAGDDREQLTERAYEVVHRLRDAFSKGLRAYEVRSRMKDGTHYIEARGSVLISVTALDERYLEGDASEINKSRLENIKFILWQYYIERRI
jgi:hypothetical protein